MPLGLAFALALAGCGSTLPYRAAPSKMAQRSLGLAEENAADARPGGPVALAFCYNNRVNSAEEVLAEARLACPAGEVTYYGSDALWTPCSLFQPARATFICTPRPDSEAPVAQ